MHTDEKKPAGDGNPTAGHTDGAILPGYAVGMLPDFDALRAEFALRGHALHCTPSGFYVQRWGLTRELPTLDDVRTFLAMLGSAA